MVRVKIQTEPESVEASEGESSGVYFPPEKDLQFIRTGCTELDCSLGGGWVLGRMCNLVGDKATGKTGISIEACANFAWQYPEGKIWYREIEAAFDESYAETLGLPVDRVDFGPDGLDSYWDTIEDIYEDLDKKLDESIESGEPGLYVIDSLDALSSRAELQRKIDEGSYGMEKQKVISQLFRRLTRKIKRGNVCILIVSQTRTNIGVTFGEKQSRSGGKAMDFYASQIVWLSRLGAVEKTYKGVKREVGVKIRAKVKKNKVSFPGRTCDFDLRFGYGIQDVDASLAFLTSAKALHRIGITEASIKSYLKELDSLEPDQYEERRAALRNAVVQTWAELEDGFAPPRRKYA